MKTEIGGIELLTEMLTQGYIKTNLYLQIKKAVEDIETPYKIIANDEK